MTTTDEPDGRTRHYGAFYGIDHPRSDVERDDDRPTLVVWGNCQAEALRVVVSGSPDLPYRTVRVPPVHELNFSDLPHVERVLAEARVVLSQPIRSGYRGLPIGTADIAEAAQRAQMLVWPVIRYGGLYPFQLIVRHPSKPSAVPAVVPYHDLRTVLAVRNGRIDAGGGKSGGRDIDGWDIDGWDIDGWGIDGWDIDVEPERLVAAARWSIDELARRERRDTDIAVSDVLLGVGVGAAHTINHPGNEVLMALGGRIVDALGAGAPEPPNRELLGNIRAPLERRVVDALGIDPAYERDEWLLDGEAVSQEHVRKVQMHWYADNPEFIDAALTRYAPLMEILGIRS